MRHNLKTLVWSLSSFALDCQTAHNFPLNQRNIAFRVAVVKTIFMTQSEFAKMESAGRAEWLSQVSPTNVWAFGDDVFCLHCDGLFKAEDVACDNEGDPTCPLCHSSTPLDFHRLPWWRTWELHT
jgi:hypothetical protein